MRRRCRPAARIRAAAWCAGCPSSGRPSPTSRAQSQNAGLAHTRRTLLRGQSTPHMQKIDEAQRAGPGRTEPEREETPRTEQKEHAQGAKPRGAGLMSAPGGASMHFLKSCAQSRGEIAPELTSQLPCPSEAAAQRMGRSRKTHKSCCRAVGKKEKEHLIQVVHVEARVAQPHADAAQPARRAVDPTQRLAPALLQHSPPPPV